MGSAYILLHINAFSQKYLKDAIRFSGRESAKRAEIAWAEVTWAEVAWAEVAWADR